MNTNNTEAGERLYLELMGRMADDAPNGWVIALLKADFIGGEAQTTLEYIDFTGHVIWHDTPCGLYRELYAALHRYRAELVEGTRCSRASLALSTEKLLSADFR